MPDTTRGWCQGLSALRSGRNFILCLEAITRPAVQWRSGQGERSNPCTYSTFFKASWLSLGRMLWILWKEWASIPFRRDTSMEGWKVRMGNVKQRGEIKGCMCLWTREKGEMALKAVGLTYSVLAATLSVMLPITPVQLTGWNHIAPLCLRAPATVSPSDA